MPIKIPENIQDYVKYDETSPSGLRWIKYDVKNQKTVGDCAGCKQSNGYWSLGFKKNSFLCHRVIFFLLNKYVPDFIDHIDGNRSNNKILNLRAASIQENSWNQKKNKRNTSGAKGVQSWTYKRNGKTIDYWRCRIVCNNTEHVRCFQKSEYTFEYCREFIKTMRKQYHKEFSNNGN